MDSDKLVFWQLAHILLTCQTIETGWTIYDVMSLTGFLPTQQPSTEKAIRRMVANGWVVAVGNNIVRRYRRYEAIPRYRLTAEGREQLEAETARLEEEWKEEERETC